MKIILMFLICFPLFAATMAPRTLVDKVQKLDWDGKNYKVALATLQKTLTVPGDSKVGPCLENAQKSEMQVLITVEENPSRISSCKLYTPGLIKADKGE